MYSVVLLLAATTSMETNSFLRHRHHGCCAVSSCSPCYTPCAPVTCCPTPCGGAVYGAPVPGGPGVEKIPVGTKKMPLVGKLSPDEEKAFGDAILLLKKSGKWPDNELKQYDVWFHQASPEDRAKSLKEIFAGKLLPPNPKMDDKKDVKPAPKDDKKPVDDKKPAPKDDKKDDKKASQLNVPARVIVLLPENAILTVDGQTTRATSSVRSFVTPALNSTGEHYYEMQATFQRNGVQIQVNRTVRVRAGETTQVTFDAPAAQGVAQK